MRYMAFVFVVLCASFVYAGGEAANSTQFFVKTPPDQVAAWLKAHPDSVAQATHSIVVSRTGDTTRLRRETVKGDYEFTMKETIKQNGSNYTYEGTLVQSHVGQVAGQVIKATLTPRNGGTVVDVYMYCKIDDRRIRSMDVRVGISKSIKGFENFMIDQFD